MPAATSGAAAAGAAARRSSRDGPTRLRESGGEHVRPARRDRRTRP
ncbi:hypothetical protein ACFSM7_09035 [Clavibacter michiganensis subsp. tessellarius]